MHLALGYDFITCLWANFVMVFSGFLIVCLYCAYEILRFPVIKFCPDLPIAVTHVPAFSLSLPSDDLLLCRLKCDPMRYGLRCGLFASRRFVDASEQDYPTVCLSLLAMTMVGSIFQLLALAIAYAAVQCLQHGCKKALKDAFQVFTIPLFLVVFYAYPAAYGDRSSSPRRLHGIISMICGDMRRLLSRCCLLRSHRCIYRGGHSP